MKNYFIVTAAGQIEIGDNANAVTGTVAGFHFGVSWGGHGYSGGVLSRTEAKKLSDHILKSLSECTDTEEERVSSVYTSLDKQKTKL